MIVQINLNIKQHKPSKSLTEIEIVCTNKTLIKVMYTCSNELLQNNAIIIFISFIVYYSQILFITVKLKL